MRATIDHELNYGGDEESANLWYSSRKWIGSSSPNRTSSRVLTNSLFFWSEERESFGGKRISRMESI